MRIAKVVAVVVACFAGAQVALGCVLAALFELQGFGRRDAEPRAWYVALLVLGLIGSVLAPLGLWRLLLPASAPAGHRLAFSAAGVTLIAVTGIALVR